MADLKSKFRNLFFHLINKIENNNDADIYRNGEYNQLKKIMSRFQGEQFILFDVGANKGDFSLTALKAFYEATRQKTMSVYAFEPLPLIYARLKENLANEKNCIPVNSGVSENNETREIYFDEMHSTCASLYNRAEVAAPSRINISLTRLDTFMEENNIPKIDFLKIDTEGHELSVLKSAGSYLNPGKIRAIQFEYGGTYLDSRIYLRDIYHLLLPKGYKIYKIYKNKIMLRDYHPSMENFQYANYVAIG